jgi:hypothetical protein
VAPAVPAAPEAVEMQSEAPIVEPEESEAPPPETLRGAPELRPPPPKPAEPKPVKPQV